MSAIKTREGFDRREALKKAAVAGAIVWTAPVIASSTASAAGVCTMKCAPSVGGSFSGPAVMTQCARNGPVNDWHPTQVTVQAITNPGSACRCGGKTTLTISGGTVVNIDENSWSHGYCPGNDHIAYVGKHPLRPNQASIYATVTCVDRDGDRLCRTCEIYGEIHYCHRRNTDCNGIKRDNPDGFPVTWTIATCNPTVCNC